MSKLVTLEGEIHWAKRDAEPNTFDPTKPDKWSVMFRPNQDQLMKIMDIQSLGIKNTLKKDDKGYYISFHRPVSRKNKPQAGPKWFEADGVTPLEGHIGNGSKGDVVIELIEYRTSLGKGTLAQYHSLIIKELIPFGNK